MALPRSKLPTIGRQQALHIGCVQTTMKLRYILPKLVQDFVIPPDPFAQYQDYFLSRLP